MSAEDLERYETEIELQLYKEYRDVLPMFSYVVETERRFYLTNQVQLDVRNEGGQVYFELRLHDAWVWDMYRPARFVANVRVVTFKDVNIEELAKDVCELAADARRRLGDAGEALVARWYESRGFVVVDRNWRCREGELDLVCAGEADGGVLVFCEVKTRRSTAFGSPLEAVTVAKQRRIRVLARKWLDEQGSAGREGGRVRAPRLRFDVAAVLALPGAAPQVQVVEAAF